MDNPYQSPGLTPQLPPGAQGDVTPLRRQGLIHHVRSVAVLMIVLGALELTISLLATIVAIVTAVATTQMRPSDAADFPGWLMSVIYGGTAVVGMATGILHVTAGVKNYQFRGRTLGIAALALGVADLFACNCFPLGAALCVYGLIVYLNEEVAEAFRLGEAGRQPNEIYAAILG
jgi:hypothetical protein